VELAFGEVRWGEAVDGGGAEVGDVGLAEAGLLFGGDGWGVEEGLGGAGDVEWGVGAVVVAGEEVSVDGEVVGGERLGGG